MRVSPAKTMRPARANRTSSRTRNRSAARTGAFPYSVIIEVPIGREPCNLKKEAACGLEQLKRETESGKKEGRQALAMPPLFRRIAGGFRTGVGSGAAVGRSLGARDASSRAATRVRRSTRSWCPWPGARRQYWVPAVVAEKTWTETSLPMPGSSVARVGSCHSGVLVVLREELLRVRNRCADVGLALRVLSGAAEREVGRDGDRDQDSDDDHDDQELDEGEALFRAKSIPKTIHGEFGSLGYWAGSGLGFHVNPRHRQKGGGELAPNEGSLNAGSPIVEGCSLIPAEFSCCRR